MYERADAFRAEIGNLDLICNIHNSIQRTMLPVEKPLIQDRLDAVDAAMQQGLAVRAHACSSQSGMEHCIWVKSSVSVNYQLCKHAHTQVLLLAGPDVELAPH